MNNFGTTTILTFSDIVSHGDDMYHFGSPSGIAFKNDDIIRMYGVFTNGTAELHNIKNNLPKCLYEIEDAYILIIRGYFDTECNELHEIFNSYDSSDEDGRITGIEWDTHRIQKGKIVENKINKRLVFMDIGDGYKYPFNSQLSHGSVYNSKRIPTLSRILSIFENTMYGPLLIEGNFYSDRNYSYSPMLKESKRSKMIKICIGASTSINFRWYKQTAAVSDIYSIQINNGDICIFSENAIGYIKEKKTTLLIKHSIGTCREAFN